MTGLSKCNGTLYVRTVVDLILSLTGRNMKDQKINFEEEVNTIII